MNSWVAFSGTTTAWIALLSWPFLTILFFRVMSIPAALTVTIVGGLLFLPELSSLDVRMLPPLDKTTIPALSAVIALLLMAPPNELRVADGILPRSRWATGMIVVMGVGTVGTVLTNQEPLHFFGFLPGLRSWDLFSALLSFFLMILPFLLARKYLASDKAQETALTAFVILALLYSLLALYEVRMSPQINVMVYGFFAHDWGQHVRPGGGFRPIVFLPHGLWLSMFLGMATLAAIGLFRSARKERRAFFLLAAIWLFGTLILSKSLGAMVITISLGLVMLAPRRVAQTAIVFLVGAVLAYPLLRSAELIPTQRIVEFASKVNDARAGSIDFRFVNEDALLQHAQKKPLFGWGGWGRNRAVALANGQPATPDGAWIIAVSFGGYVGFVALFGLFSIGVLALAFGARPPTIVALTIALMLTANLIDLIPNSMQSSITWMLAGTLVGRMELRELARSPVPSQVPPSERGRAVYARNSLSQSPYRRTRADRRLTR